MKGVGRGVGGVCGLKQVGGICPRERAGNSKGKETAPSISQ